MSNEQVAKLRSEYDNQVTALKESLEAQHRIAIDAAHEKHAQEVTMLKQGMDEQTSILRGEVSGKENCLRQLGEIKVALTKCKSELDSKTVQIIEMQEQMKKASTKISDGERQLTEIVTAKENIISELEREKAVYEQKIRNFGGVLVTIAGDIPISQEVQNAVVTADQASFHASLRKLQDEVKAFVTGSHTDVKEKAERPLNSKVEEQMQEIEHQKELCKVLEDRLKDANNQVFKQTGEIEELRQEVKNLDERLAESEERVQTAALQIEQREAEDSLLGEIMNLGTTSEIRSLTAQNRELMERHESDILELRAKHQREVSQLKDEHQDTIQNLTRLHQESMGKIESKLEKEQKKMKNLQNKLIEQANSADLAMNSSRIEREQSAIEVEKLKRQIDEMSDRYKEEIENVQRQSSVSPTKTSMDLHTPMSNITTDDSQHLMTMSLLGPYPTPQGTGKRDAGASS
jgi:chromosome segregation ATPase